MSYLSTSPGDANNLGYFPTLAALEAAFPVGVPGAFAVIGTTDTVWVWDEATTDWVNTGNPAPGPVGPPGPPGPPGPAGPGAMVIGDPITSAIAGSVLFAGVGGVLQQDNANFFYDDTNNRLGLRTTSPERSLDVRGGGYTNNQDFGLQIANPAGEWRARFSIKSDASGNARTAIETVANNFGGIREAISILPNGNMGLNTNAPASLLDVNGVLNVGNLANSNAQLIVKGGVGGSALIHLERTGMAFDWSLAGGGLAFRDVTGGGNVVANMFGSGSVNQLYIGQKGRGAVDTSNSLISATTLAGTASVTNGAGTWLRLQGGLGTGSGVPGDVEISTGTALASGTAAQSSSIRVTIKGETGDMGVGILNPLQRLAVAGNQSTSGYLFVGSNAVPPNTTAGDLSAQRLAVGPGTTLVNGTYAGIAGTLTATAVGAIAGVNVVSTINPTGNSAADFRSLSMSNNFNTAFNLTAALDAAPKAGYFENRITNAGTINTINGILSNGMLLPAAAASLGTVTNVNSILVRGVNSFGNALTTTITNTFGVRVLNNGVGLGPINFINTVGIGIDNQTTGTNNTNLLIGQSAVPTGNFGIYNSSAYDNYFAGNMGIGTITPATRLDVSGAYTQRPLATDPADPANGNSVQWVSDGTGSGDVGDVMMKITVGATTKLITLIDYSIA